MPNAIRYLRPVLIVLAVVGAIAALVYGLCALSVFQVGSSSPDPASGRVYSYERTLRGGGWRTVYVTRTVDLTSRISGWIAGTIWGTALAALLLVLVGEGLRLLIPGNLVFANRELARYREKAGPNGVTAEALRYIDAWRDYHRRNSLGLAWLLGGLVFLVLWLPSTTDRALRATVSISWMIGCAVVIVWTTAFRCPRCGERFSSRGRGPQTPTFCTHCGLPAHSMKPDEVSPDFAEWKLWNKPKK